MMREIVFKYLGLKLFSYYTKKKNTVCYEGVTVLLTTIFSLLLCILSIFLKCNTSPVSYCYATAMEDLLLLNVICFTNTHPLLN